MYQNMLYFSRYILKPDSLLTIKACILALILLFANPVFSSGLTFNGENPSFDIHPSGDVILWYKKEGMRESVLTRIPYQDCQLDYSSQTTIDSLPETDAICTVTISTGGVIYVGWRHGTTPLIIAGYTPDGEQVLYREPEYHGFVPGNFTECKTSSALDDNLYVIADNFTYTVNYKDEGENRLFHWQADLPDGGARPFVGKSGETGFLKKSPAPADIEFCLYNRNLIQDRDLYCRTAYEVFDQSVFQPPVILSGLVPPGSPGDEYQSILVFVGSTTVQIYSFEVLSSGNVRFIGTNSYDYASKNTGLKVVETANSLFSDHQALPEGDQNQAVGEHSSVFSILFKTEIDKEVSRVNMIHLLTNPYHATPTPTLILPESVRFAEPSDPALLVEDNTPCDMPPGYQPIHEFYGDRDGNVFHVLVDEKGHLKYDKTVAVPFFSGMEVEQTSAAVSNGRIVVLAGSGHNWRLSDIGLEEFNLTAQSLSTQFNRGANDLSYGLEVRVDGLEDTDNVQKWALVHQSSDNIFTSLINDEDIGNLNPPCNKTINAKNRHNINIMGTSLSPGATSFGITNAQAFNCIDAFYNSTAGPQNFYLMKYSNGQWSFSGKRLQLETRYDSQGTLYWKPVPSSSADGDSSQLCGSIDFALSSLKLNFTPSDRDRRPDDFGYGHVIFNAVNMDNATNPPLFPNHPHGEDNNDGLSPATIAGITTAGFVVIVTIPIVSVLLVRRHIIAKSRAGYSNVQ